MQYLDSVNKAYKKCNKIPIYILGLEQKFYISNKKNNRQFFFFSNNKIIKIKYYKTIINVLQSLASAKLDKLLLSIKRPIN